MRITSRTAVVAHVRAALSVSFMVPAVWMSTETLLMLLSRHKMSGL